MDDPLAGEEEGKRKDPGRPGDGPSLPARAARSASRVLLPFFLAALAGGLAGFADRVSWLGELACHFRVQYAWAAALCLPVFLAARRWVLGGAAAGLLALHLALVLPLHAGPPLPPGGVPDGPALRVSFLNVHTSNRDPGPALAHVRRARPHLLGLAEIDARWAGDLAPLRGAYPHGRLVTRDDNFGIGLLSRIPLDSAEARCLTPSSPPAIVARFRWAGRPRTVVVVHALPPASPAYRRARDEQLRALARARQGLGSSVVVIGDFNATSWCGAFRSLLEDADLRDSRRGFGVQATWLAGNPLLALPVDHALHSPDALATARSVGPDVGSDHRPVTVDLVFAPP